MSRLSEKVRMCLGTLLILVVSVAAFSRCFDYGLINLDDCSYILGHPDVVRFSGWNSLVWCFTDVSEAIWMPLTWLSYAADSWLFGRWFGGFHVHSVVLHAVNAILVWRLLTLLVPRNGQRGMADICCLLAALAWAIHPLRCESVVFLASRKDVLSFFWELLALIMWVRGSRCEAVGRRVILTALSVAFFVLGAMCKPSVMTFPLLCFLLDALVLRCVRPLRYVVPVALMLGLGVFAEWQQSFGGATADGAGEPPWARLAVAASAFGLYLRDTVLPLWLAPQCVKQWPAWPRFLVPGVFLSLLCCGWLVRRCRWYRANMSESLSVERQDGCPVRLTFCFPADFVFVGLAWFVFALAPMLGLASFGFHSHADRFTYIPSVGLALLLAVGLTGLWRRIGAVRTCLSSAVVLSALAAATVWQTGFWRDDLSLFSRTLSVDGDGNYFAHHSVALHHFGVTHDLGKAREHFEKARLARAESLDENLDFYVMTLVELGAEDEVPPLMRQFEKSLVRRFGEDAALGMLRGWTGLAGRAGKLAVTYRLARVAALLGTRPSLEEARRELDELHEVGVNGGVWQYLAWRCLLLSGEKAAADEMLCRLLDPSTDIDCAQFAFLKSRPR